MHPGQKLKPGARVVFEGIHTIHGEILERRFFGRRLIRLWTEDGSPVDEAVDAIGHMPLPPYIKRDDRDDDRDRYQTVFARTRGSIAAPTAGLHFTPELTAALVDRGVETRRDHPARRLRHVPAGPRRSRRGSPPRGRALRDRRGRRGGDQPRPRRRPARHRRRHDDDPHARSGRARARRPRSPPAPARRICSSIPGAEFRVVSGLLTNFHLPQSSLLMLVSAFAGRERVRSAYDAAIARALPLLQLRRRDADSLIADAGNLDDGH